MKRTKPIWITLLVLALLILLPSSCRVIIEPNGVVQPRQLAWIWRGFAIGPFEALVNPYLAQQGIAAANVAWIMGMAVLFGAMIFSYPLKPGKWTAGLSIVGTIMWVISGVASAMAWK